MEKNLERVCMNKKKQIWSLETRLTGNVMVQFEEEVTLEEAIEKFNNVDYLDVFAENITDEVATGEHVE